MRDRTRVQQLMPLMREFGSLERKRLGAGVTPLEFQRWLDLKGQIGRSFARSREAGLSALGSDGEPKPSRLRVAFKTRAALLDAIIDNLQPAGFFLPTPFAAEVGTRFLVRMQLEHEGESADLPCVVATSIVQGAHTLSTMSMGMSLKIERLEPAQRAAVSRLFGGVLDASLGLDR